MSTTGNHLGRSHLQHLENNIQSLLSWTLAPSTTRNYTAAYNRYQKFCSVHNLQAAPIHEHNLMLFISSISTTSISNIKSHLAAIKHHMILYGYHQVIPPLPRLYMLTRAIKRTNRHNTRPNRNPITISKLNQLKHYLSTNTLLNIFDQTMLWAAFLTAFFGFLRSSEYVSPTTTYFDPETTLLLSDVQFINQRTHIHIKASKTDPFRHGCTIRLSPTNSHICPTTAITSYINMHPTNTGPLFTYSDGTYLTRRRLNTILRTVFRTHNHISSHSFRIGAATTAAAAGYPQWLIQQLGRWNSDCFRTYIRIPNTTIDRVSTSLTGHYNITNAWDPNTY